MYVLALISEDLNLGLVPGIFPTKQLERKREKLLRNFNKS